MLTWFTVCKIYLFIGLHLTIKNCHKMHVQFTSTIKDVLHKTQLNMD